MKPNLVLFALVLSLLFNVFFIAGYTRARRAAARDVTDVVGRELDLNDAQYALFKQLRAVGHDDAEMYRDSITLVRHELVQELDRPDGDPRRLAEIVEREADVRRQWKLADASRLVEFIESLTPEQRHAMRLRMKRATDGDRPAWRIRRFDTNGDGVLDDEERQAAHARMQALRAERAEHWRQRFGNGPDGDHRRWSGGPGRPGRPGGGSAGSGGERRIRRELMKRFDADGDGTLDANERETLLDWVGGQSP